MMQEHKLYKSLSHHAHLGPEASELEQPRSSCQYFKEFIK